jgi:hypothetical protein
MGEAPLTSLTDSHAFLGAAQDTLDRVNRSIQAETWWFNLEKLELTPSPIDASLYLPSDTLEVRTGNQDYVQRGDRIYNLDGGTYEFDKPMTVQIVRLVDFEELPEVAATFIGTSAVLDFQVNYDGDSTRMRELNKQLEQAMIPMTATQTRNRITNLIDNNVRLQRLKGTTRFARQGMY